MRCLVLSQVDGIDLLYILQIRIWYIYSSMMSYKHVSDLRNLKNINIPGEMMIKISPSRIKPGRFESFGESFVSSCFIPIVSRGRT